MSGFANGIPKVASFIVKNTTNPKKIVRVFQTNIYPGDSLDLMTIPGIGVSDIQDSIDKGDLGRRITFKQLVLISTNISYQIVSSNSGGSFTLPAGGSIIVTYATCALLAASDASTLNAGALAYVTEVDRYFEWYPGALPTNLTLTTAAIFAGTGATGNWIFKRWASEKWIAQKNWEISSTGSDLALGDSTAPLATLDEWFRRTNGDYLNATTITIDNNITNQGTVFNVRCVDLLNGTLNFTGKYVNGQTGTSSSFVNHVTTAGSGALAKITLPGAAIAVGSRVLIFVGATTTVRNTVHILNALGSGVYEIAYDDSGFTTPQASDTYAVVPYITFDIKLLHGNTGSSVTWTNINSRNLFSCHGQADKFVDCKFGFGCTVDSTGGDFTRCRFDSAVGLNATSGVWKFTDCCFRNNTNANITFTNCNVSITGAMFYNSCLENNNSIMTITNYVGFFLSSTTCLINKNNGIINNESGVLYGANNNQVAQLSSGSMLFLGTFNGNGGSNVRITGASPSDPLTTPWVTIGGNTSSYVLGTTGYTSTILPSHTFALINDTFGNTIFDFGSNVRILQQAL